MKTVFTNGCFDLIHVGHIRYLKKARELGDLLVVGLNSDESVRRLKGITRPLISQNYRKEMLLAFSFVDKVEIFEDDTPLNLIKRIKPDVLVKGGDYDISEIVGSKEVLEYGGQVKSLEFYDGFSTTSLIEKIIKDVQSN